MIHMVDQQHAADRRERARHTIKKIKTALGAIMVLVVLISLLGITESLN